MLEVDQATGSAYLLEAPWATGSTYLWAYLRCLHCTLVCQSHRVIRRKINTLIVLLTVYFHTLHRLLSKTDILLNWFQIWASQPGKTRNGHFNQPVKIIFFAPIQKKLNHSVCFAAMTKCWAPFYLLGFFTMKEEFIEMVRRRRHAWGTRGLGFESWQVMLFSLYVLQLSLSGRCNTADVPFKRHLAVQLQANLALNDKIPAILLGAHSHPGKGHFLHYLVVLVCMYENRGVGSCEKCFNFLITNYNTNNANILQFHAQDLQY